MVEAKNSASLLFDAVSNAAQMREIWGQEGPFTGECAEVAEHLNNLETEAPSESPFAGNFGFIRCEDPTNIIAKMEYKVRNDRVFLYASGVMDPKYPEGIEIVDGKKMDVGGMIAELKEDGNFDCGHGFGMVKLPNEPPLRYFTQPEDCLYGQHEVFCIGAADKLIEKS